MKDVYPINSFFPSLLLCLRVCSGLDLRESRFRLQLRAELGPGAAQHSPLVPAEVQLHEAVVPVHQRDGAQGCDPGAHWVRVCPLQGGAPG